MDSGGVRKRRDVRPGDEGASPDKNVAAKPIVDGTDGGFITLFKIASVLMITPVLLLIAVDLLVQGPIDPESFSLPTPPKFEGPLAQNELLTLSEKLHQGQLKGPESITVQHGHLYTGTADGKILHIHEGKMRIITRLGKPPCGSFDDEPTCGRPLGMRFNGEGYLIVADAYLGLFKVNVTTGQSEVLWPASKPVGGKPSKFLNDLDIASDGMIYLSDSSTTWDRRNHPLAIMENKPDGRLLRYDPSTGEMTLLKDGLYFANGVQLSPKQDYLLVAETSRSRILKYQLTGSDAGHTTVFIDNLPGLPDNVRASSADGFWVGIASHRSADTFSMFDTFAPWPSVRRIVAKIFNLQTISKMAVKPYGLILELNPKGEIVRSLHDPEGKKIPNVSEVEDVAGHLYFGSFHADYIGKLDLR